MSPELIELAKNFYNTHYNAITNIKSCYYLEKLFSAMYPEVKFTDILNILVYHMKCVEVYYKNDRSYLKWHRRCNVKKVVVDRENEKLQEIINQQQKTIELLLKQINLKK
jgi:hypothetical protein